MAAKNETADFVKAIFDDLVKLDEGLAKARKAYNDKMGLFRSLQRAGETTDEQNNRFPIRKRRTKAEMETDMDDDMQ